MTHGTGNAAQHSGKEKLVQRAHHIPVHQPQRPTVSKMAVCRMVDRPPSPVNSNSSDAPLNGLRAPGNAAYREALGFEQPERPPADMSGGTCKEDSCFHFRWFASSQRCLRTATISQNVNWFRTKPPLQIVQPSRCHSPLQLSMPRHALESHVFRVPRSRPCRCHAAGL